MSQSARDSIYEALSAIRLVDPHTHINPHSPASSTLADILGYHYYTELVHSAGMPREEIEESDIGPRELVRRLVRGLPNIENTANYRWLIDICREFFGFEDSVIDDSNWEALYDAAEERMSGAEWAQTVLDKSNVAAVFLTNDFDDDLEGFDTSTYIPCLRTDDLVFHLGKRETQERLQACTGIELDGSLSSLRASLEQRFEHFVASGAKACAISLPPSFEPKPIGDGRASIALDQVMRLGASSSEADQVAVSRRIFWTLAELCDHHNLPFDLMIGVNRGVYPKGVYQGQDLYDSRVSMIQYRELFGTFSDVKFPVSVLASVTNQELCSYAWIFPNVITNGHWWYSNTPSFIRRDATARLEAVPRNNQIGYYSDAYKLEFVWPKFDMYRRVLAGVLADEFVVANGWSEERAIELGRQVLRDNVDEIFGSSVEEPIDDDENGNAFVAETIALGTEGVGTDSEWLDDDEAQLSYEEETPESESTVDDETDSVVEIVEEEIVVEGEQEFVDEVSESSGYEQPSDETADEEDGSSGSILPGVATGAAALAAGAAGMFASQGSAADEVNEPAAADEVDEYDHEEAAAELTEPDDELVEESLVENEQEFVDEVSESSGYEQPSDETADEEDDSSGSILPGVATGAAALAAGAAGMFASQDSAADEVDEPAAEEVDEYDHEEAATELTESDEELDEESLVEDTIDDPAETDPAYLETVDQTEFEELQSELPAVEEPALEEPALEQPAIEYPEPTWQTDLGQVAGVYEQPYQNVVENVDPATSDTWSEDDLDEGDDDASVFDEQTKDESSLMEVANEADLEDGSTLGEEDPPVELDPSPTIDEIQATEVDDVELIDDSVLDRMPDADQIEMDADDAPLDVGDLLSSEPDTEPDVIEVDLADHTSSDQGFDVSEDSMKLQADPHTGELRFPVEESDGPSFGEGVFEELENIQETIDWQDPEDLSK